MLERFVEELTPIQQCLRSRPRSCACRRQSSLIGSSHIKHFLILSRIQRTAIVEVSHLSS